MCKKPAKCIFAINWQNNPTIFSNYFNITKRQTVAYFNLSSEFDINVLTINMLYIACLKLSTCSTFSKSKKVSSMYIL